MRDIKEITVKYDDGTERNYCRKNERNTGDVLIHPAIDYIKDNKGESEVLDELGRVSYPAILYYGLYNLSRCDRDAARSCIKLLRIILDTVEKIIRTDEEGER